MSFPFAEGVPPLPDSGPRAEAARLADAARRIIDRIARVALDEEEYAREAAELEAMAERLEATGREREYWGFAEAANAGDPHAFFDRSPFIGAANPIAPPISLWVEGDAVRGSAVYGTAYEGPPGCVHGGHVAAAFDEVLGFAQSMTGAPGMTGTLTVKYRSPTPLHKELHFEGRVDRVEGRKIFTTGTCHADGVLTAEAEGIFITVDFLRFATLMEERQG